MIGAGLGYSQHLFCLGAASAVGRGCILIDGETIKESLLKELLQAFVANVPEASVPRFPCLFGFFA